ncbi:zinc knuckle CX2CX4HX4C containing protein [Tanacetum coccineum]|uniref:Zinc knuckle CX2CX4HX4C containing protein n=1 Tax=Tanacetum coccineum TaxID=301880 RepID=A0ABQ5H9K0_9ASTR
MNGTVNFDRESVQKLSKVTKDGGVSGDGIVDCEEVTGEVGDVTEVIDVVTDKVKSLSDTDKNDLVIEENKNDSRREDVKIQENSDEVMVAEGSKRWEKNIIEEGLEFIVNNGPWMVKNKPLIVQKWDINVCLDKTDLDTISLWVKICNVPLEAWTVKGISALASRVGRPLVMDNVSDSMQYGRNKDGVRTEESRQNDTEEKRKMVNFSKDSNDGKADSEGFITVQKRKNGDDAGKINNPNYKPNTQHPRFVNQKNNVNGKANVQKAWNVNDDILSAMKKSANKFSVFEIYDENDLNEIQNMKRNEKGEKSVDQRKDQMINKGEEVECVKCCKNKEVEDVYNDDTGMGECMVNDGMDGMDRNVLQDC